VFSTNHRRKRRKGRIKIVGLAAEQDEIVRLAEIFSEHRGWMVEGCISTGALYDQARSGEFDGASSPDEEGHTQSPTTVSPMLPAPATRMRTSNRIANLRYDFSRLSSHLMVAGYIGNDGCAVQVRTACPT
jgi:hypothetical protein